MSVAVLNTDASLTGKTLMAKEVSETITGVKTFDLDPSAPFAVSSGSAVVTNLDADSVDGAHYASGTWTPTLVSSGGGTPTYGTQSGLYTKVGSRVTVDGFLVISAFNTLAAGTLTIAGLPFTCNASAHGTAHIPYWGILSANASSLNGYVVLNTATIALLWVTGAGQAFGSTQLTKADITAAMTFIFTATYYV